NLSGAGALSAPGWAEIGTGAAGRDDSVVDCGSDYGNHGFTPDISAAGSYGAFHMPKTTPATSALRKLGIAFKLHTYGYDSTSEHLGLQAAEALDDQPSRMVMTLAVEVG